MNDKINACPHCDSSQVEFRTGKRGQVERGYYCTNCHERFVNPKRRERYGEYTARSGLAAKLLELDPEEVFNG